MGPFAIAGAVSGLAKGVFSAIQGAKMIKEAKKINPIYEKYQTSQAAKNMAGMAQTNLNAVNPSFGMQQRAIQGSQANAMAGVNRNVTDSSQALAMAAGIQGQSDLASANLGIQMDNAKQQNIQNYMRAQDVLVGEDRMKYQDMLNKYQMDLQQKNALRSAGQQNIASGIGAIGGTAFGLAQLNLGNSTKASAPASTGVLGPSLAQQTQSFGQSRRK